MSMTVERFYVHRAPLTVSCAGGIFHSTWDAAAAGKARTLLLDTTAAAHVSERPDPYSENVSLMGRNGHPDSEAMLLIQCHESGRAGGPLRWKGDLDRDQDSDHEGGWGWGPVGRGWNSGKGCGAALRKEVLTIITHNPMTLLGDPEMNVWKW